MLVGLWLLLAFVFSVNFPEGAPIKKEFGFDSLFGTLGGILIIVLLVERVTEIALTLWRRKPGDPAKEDDYKAETKRIALLIGFSLGVVVCSAGIGLLSAVVGTSAPSQGFIRFIDIFLTAGLIAGGSDGFHQFVSTIETFFVESRKKMQKDSGDGQSDTDCPI